MHFYLYIHANELCEFNDKVKNNAGKVENSKGMIVKLTQKLGKVADN